MEKLPRELRRLLIEIAPHEDEPDYLRSRFESLGYEDAKGLLDKLLSLRQRGFVTLPENRVEKVYEIRPAWKNIEPGTIAFTGDGLSIGLHYPAMFTLTHEGRNYRSLERRMLCGKAVAVLATALLSGLFAWVFPAIASGQLLDDAPSAERMVFSEPIGDCLGLVEAASLEVMPSEADVI